MIFHPQLSRLLPEGQEVLRVSLAALVLFAPFVSPAQSPRIFSAPFDLHGGLILLRGQVNGTPARFLLDTGSNVSFLDVRLSPIRFKAEKVRGVGMPGCILDHAHVTAGGLDLPDQRLCVADLSDISKSIKAHVDGLIGQDVLRQFSAVRIDYKAQMVTLEE